MVSVMTSTDWQASAIDGLSRGTTLVPSVYSDNDSVRTLTSGLCANEPDTGPKRGAVLPQNIYPTSPSETKRYSLGRTVKDDPPICVIEPLTISFPEKRKLPPGWHCRIHPEGLPFFVAPVSSDCEMRIVTEEWMYDPEIAEPVESFVQEIRNAISEHEVVLWPGSDLFIELFHNPDNSTRCGYYFVCHSRRSVYWLEDVELQLQSKPLKDVRGDLSGYQTEICLEVEYWTYWDSFPNLQEVTPDTYEYVVDVLVSAMTDVISSRHSTITFSYKQLRDMLKIVQTAKDRKTSNWHIGRFMKNIIQDRLRNYYGTWGARLASNKAVLKTDGPRARSKLMEIVSPFLFFIPHAQLDRVEALIVDRSVIMIQWEKLFEDLQEEWNQTAVLATIMLTANCAFLAIPLFQASKLVSHSSPEQIASYLSLTTSLFGLILGIVMHRHHKTRRPSTPDEIFDYVYGKDRKTVQFSRTQHLFLIWSLPHGLVMWSVITFLVAFLVMCFLGTLTATRVVVGFSTFILASFTFYYLVRFGGGQELLRIWFERIKGSSNFGRVSRCFKTIRGWCPRLRRRTQNQAEQAA